VLIQQAVKQRLGPLHIVARLLLGCPVRPLLCSSRPVRAQYRYRPSTLGEIIARLVSTGARHLWPPLHHDRQFLDNVAGRACVHQTAAVSTACRAGKNECRDTTTTQWSYCETESSV